MVDLRDEEFELNEVNWWSNWASLDWVSKNSYVLLSDDFAEPFFNRGGFVAPEGFETALGRMESAFRTKGRTPYVLLQRLGKYSGIEEALKRYEAVDVMSVMELTAPSFKNNPEVKVEVVDANKARDWSETYLLSFYGDRGLMNPVERIVKKILKLKEATLLLAIYRGSAAGTAAIYRRGGLSGVYCVGTRPEFRNRGVASAMLESAHSKSKEDGDKVILQSMLSDEVETVYVKAGFSRVYVKRLLRRR